MNRRKFIKQSCISCITGMAISEVLQGCAGIKYAAGTIKNDDMIVPLSDFLDNKKKSGGFRKYVVVQDDIFQYPICVYRFSDTEYEAIWLQCSHQGAELQVFGVKLQCPAHGSDFSNRGMVQNGPADMPLRKFPVTIDGNSIKISLKKE